MNGYDILKWDTDFFGFPVAKINMQNVDANELSNIIDDLKEKNVSLAYWSTNSNDVLSNKAAVSLNGFLTGEKVTYFLDLEYYKKKPVEEKTSVIEFKEEQPDKNLQNLIVEGGIFSRFYVDPKISNKQYEDLHRFWIANSVKNNTIFVIREDEKIIAFVSLNEKNNRGNIDFIVVDKHHRGKGFATKLMDHAHMWFASKNYKAVQADTQIENKNACNMYKKFGYKKEKTEKNYHFWL